MKTKKQQKNIDNILNTIPIFLAKTYKIVDNPEYDNIICWSNDGQSFIIKDINKLTTQIFPKHFKHSNFASFVRQLNMYGFHKVKIQQDGHAFAHQCFQKNQVQKLNQIKRKNNSTNDIQQANQSNMMVPLRRSQQTEFQKQLNIVRNKHQDLQNFVSMLVEQNKQILLQNRTFVNKMSKMQQKYKNKLETLMLLLLFGKAKNNNGQPFILPQQFQNMLESFNQSNNNNNNNKINNNNNNKNFQLNSQKRKRQKIQQPLKMLKNISQAQYQKIKSVDLQQKQKDQLGQLIQQLKNSKKQNIDDLQDSLGFIPPSPNHSYISFPELYDKHQEVSQFLDKIHGSDFEDLNLVQDK